MPAAPVRYYISFKGRVQGVGFRWRAQTIANDLGLTGWVRNEYDGSVSMELQGPIVTIYQLIDTMENDRWIRIDEKYMREIPLEPHETQFRVRS